MWFTLTRQDQESNYMNVIRNNSAQRDDAISIIEMVLACCESGGSKIPQNGWDTGDETQRKMPRNSR
jgi:hypothetical protein